MQSHRQALFFYVEGENHTNETQSKTNRYERRGKPQGNAPEMMADFVLETSHSPCQRWMLSGGDKTPPLLIIRDYEFNASIRRCEKVGETKSTTTKVREHKQPQHRSKEHFQRYETIQGCRARARICTDCRIGSLL